MKHKKTKLIKLSLYGYAYLTRFDKLRKTMLLDNRTINLEIVTSTYNMKNVATIIVVFKYKYQKIVLTRLCHNKTKYVIVV